MASVMRYPFHMRDLSRTSRGYCTTLTPNTNVSSRETTVSIESQCRRSKPCCRVSAISHTVASLSAVKPAAVE